MKTLLLTENVLSDINKYTNDNTDIILYNNEDTYDSILNKINSDTSYNTIGIFSHGNHHSFDFVEKININENNNFINFINSLKTKTNFNTLDIFACYFGNNSQFIKTLEEKTNINVRASKNITGSTVFGDWIMETDQIDIKTIYFNENISDFKEILINMASSLNKKRSNYICNLINPNNINELRNHIYSNDKTFAVLTNDGKVFMSGGSVANGSYVIDSNTLSPLTDVKAIYSNNNAFAALTNEGKVFRWGKLGYGGGSDIFGSYLIYSGIELTNVKAIYSNSDAFAALTDDGRVFRWGLDEYGGGSVPNGSYVIDSGSHLTNVKAIYSNSVAFAALTDDGRVFRWGLGGFGGDSVAYGAYITGLTNVKAIYSNNNAFAALTDDGRVFRWGDGYGGGSVPNGSYLSDSVDELTNVKAIFPSHNMFSALTTEGKVFRWDTNGYYLSDSVGHLTDVKAIYFNLVDWIAVKNDGTVIFSTEITHSINFVNPTKILDFNNINIYKSPYFTYENIKLFYSMYHNPVNVIDFEIHSNKCVLNFQEVKNTLDNPDVDIKDIINYYLYSAGISGNPNVLIIGIMSIAPDIPTTKQNLLCINHKNLFNVNNLAQNECLFSSYIDDANISDNYNITDGNELSLNITKSDNYYVFNNISTPANYVPIGSSFNYKY